MNIYLTQFFFYYYKKSIFFRLDINGIDLIFSALRLPFYFRPCFHLGVPALPSGFPLYLFPLRFKRMPLQSLTLQALLS